MKPQGQADINAFNGDRFELLSAYVDGEVTAAERKQVEEWLATDPTVQQLHARLMSLRHAFRTLPAPAPSQSVERTVQQVMAKLDRRPNLRLVWAGGAAIAAALVGAVALQFSQPQVAQKDPATPPVQTAQNAQTPETGGLMVELDQPVLAFAATETVSPTKAPVKSNQDAY